MRLAFVRVRHVAPASRIFHCCVHKTASQWIRRVLSDARVYRASGLRPFNYQLAWMKGAETRKLTERRFDRTFPRKTIVTPVYGDYECFASIPGNEDARAFFVMRDPRDIVVSWYFSVRNSHGLMGDIGERRKRLRQLGRRDGLLVAMEYLSDFGLFESLRSWKHFGNTDERVVMLRFEDLTGAHSEQVFESLFRHLGISIEAADLPGLLKDHSFERLTGRARGDEDAYHHYRKGVHGDWRNHFDTEVQDRFRNLTGDLVETLGYTA
jgi:hypothetical protein